MFETTLCIKRKFFFHQQLSRLIVCTWYEIKFSFFWMNQKNENNFVRCYIQFFYINKPLSNGYLFSHLVFLRVSKWRLNSISKGQSWGIWAAHTRHPSTLVPPGACQKQFFIFSHYFVSFRERELYACLLEWIMKMKIVRYFSQTFEEMKNPRKLTDFFLDVTTLRKIWRK